MARHHRSTKQLTSCLLAAVILLIAFNMQSVELARSSSSSSSTGSNDNSGSRIVRFDFGSQISNFRQTIRTRLGDLASKAFETFAKTYNRTYTSEELSRRLEVFLNRFKMVQSWNKDYMTRKVSYTMKLNHLADRTDEELEQMNGLKTPSDFGKKGVKSNSRKLARGRNLRAVSVPTSKDWRSSPCLPAVRDQGSCGCCYAFATVDMVSTNYCSETSSSNRDMRSVQQIVDCGSRDWQYGVHMNGCDGGWPEHNIKYLQKKSVLATEQQYPYKARVGTCSSSLSGLAVSKATNGPQYVELTSEDEFKQHIGQYGPVAAAVHASNRFQMYNGGIFDDTLACLGRQWNHAVLVVGYGRSRNQDYWLIKNSYGRDWGENGYMRMARGKHLCKIGRMGWGLLPKSTSGISYEATSRQPYTSARPTSRYQTSRPSFYSFFI